MAQGLLPFKYEQEKKDTGMTAFREELSLRQPDFSKESPAKPQILSAVKLGGGFGISA